MCVDIRRRPLPPVDSKICALVDRLHSTQTANRSPDRGESLYERKRAAAAAAAARMIVYRSRDLQPLHPLHFGDCRRIPPVELGARDLCPNVASEMREASPTRSPRTSELSREMEGGDSPGRALQVEAAVGPAWTSIGPAGLDQALPARGGHELRREFVIGLAQTREHSRRTAIEVSSVRHKPLAVVRTQTLPTSASAYMTLRMARWGQIPQS